MKKYKDSQGSKVISKRVTVLVSIILIILLGFYVYVNSLSGQFIWDDCNLVRDNPYIKSLLYTREIFTEHIGAGAKKIYISYRPLQMLTYMMDYSLWGLNTVGYHLTNILLHILVALAVYWLISILFNDWLLSLFTGLLFVVHPIHTEAVSYISGRADPLSALLIIVCFVLYIKYIKNKNVYSYILMLICFCLALLSKESSIILPLLFVFYHYIFRKKINIKEFLPILGIATFYIILRLTVLKFTVPFTFNYANTTVFQRLPGAFIAITRYIGLMLLPFNLHLECGLRLFKINNPYAISGVLIVILLLIYAFKKRTTNELLSFSVFWFFAALLPVSNIYPINAYMAEHWLYLPSIGFFLILSWILSSLYRIRRLRVLIGIFAIGLLSFYSYLTIKQNECWRDPISFYERTLRYAPDSYRLYSTLGNEYSVEGRHEEAINSCKKAIKLNPGYPYSYYNLGNAYSSLARFDEAITSYKKTIELDPNYYYAYNNLGIAYFHAARFNEAIASYKKALELAPQEPRAYYNLALVYCKKKQYDLAIKYSDKVTELGHKLPDKFLELLEPYRDKN